MKQPKQKSQQEEAEEKQGFNKTTKTDILSIDPRNIRPEKGFNLRVIDPDSEDMLKLTESIKENGLRQPLLVRTNPDAKEDGIGYILIDGERRWTAIMKLIAKGEDIQYVKARSVKISNEEALLSIFLLNDGEPLTPIAKAEGVRRLIDVYGYKRIQVAKKLGEASSTISNLMKLSAMPLSVKNKVEENLISSTIVLAIARQFSNEDEFVAKINELAALAEEEEEAAEVPTNELEFPEGGIPESEIGTDELEPTSDDLSPQKDNSKTTTKKTIDKPQPKKKQAKVTVKHVKKVLGETNPLTIALELAQGEITKYYTGERRDFFVSLICLLNKKGTTKAEILSAFDAYATVELHTSAVHKVRFIIDPASVAPEDLEEIIDSQALQAAVSHPSAEANQKSVGETFITTSADATIADAG